MQPQPHKLTDVIAQCSAENLSKRLHSSLTPYTSPAKPSLFRSPVPKKQRRMRTGTESKTMATTDQPLTMTGHIANLQKPNFKLSDFLSSSTDEQSIVELRTIINQYMLLKIACTDKGKTIIDIQSYLTLSKNIKAPECSNVVYYKVLHQRCDDKETLLNIINDIYTEFIATGKKKQVFLEGDQATYERLQSIKRD